MGHRQTISTRPPSAATKVGSRKADAVELEQGDAQITRASSYFVQHWLSRRLWLPRSPPKIRNNELDANSLVEIDIPLAYEGIETVDILERRILEAVRGVLGVACQEQKGATPISLYQRTDQIEAAQLAIRY